jgi:hypothetical protein
LGFPIGFGDGKVVIQEIKKSVASSPIDSLVQQSDGHMTPVSVIHHSYVQRFSRKPLEVFNTTHILTEKPLKVFVKFHEKILQR